MLRTGLALARVDQDQNAIRRQVQAERSEAREKR